MQATYLAMERMSKDKGGKVSFHFLHVMVDGCYHYHFNGNSHQGGLIIFHWHAMAVNIIIITPREA